MLLFRDVCFYNLSWFVFIIYVQTSFVPDKEQYNMTKSQLLAQMDVSMGGRVAEELVFGPDKVTTGMENSYSC